MAFIHSVVRSVTEAQMPKVRTVSYNSVPYDLQTTIDSLDVSGAWDWDAINDLLFADPLVAMLFNVDPSSAATGLPLAAYMDGIHPEDRIDTARSISQSAQAGKLYVAEYRVRSADGITRWVLARGRFELDHTGRPARGRGIVIDITQCKVNEDDSVVETSAPSGHPLERIADLCLTIREESEALQDALVKQLANMLLLEAGRGLDRLDAPERRKRAN